MRLWSYYVFAAHLEQKHLFVHIKVWPDSTFLFLSEQCASPYAQKYLMPTSTGYQILTQQGKKKDMTDYLTDVWGVVHKVASIWAFFFFETSRWPVHMHFPSGIPATVT